MKILLTGQIYSLIDEFEIGLDKDYPVFDGDLMFRFLVNYDTSVLTVLDRDFGVIDDMNFLDKTKINEFNSSDIIEKVSELVLIKFNQWYEDTRNIQGYETVIFKFNHFLEYLSNQTHVFDMILETRNSKRARTEVFYSNLRKNCAKFESFDYELPEKYRDELLDGYNTYTFKLDELSKQQIQLSKQLIIENENRYGVR